MTRAVIQISLADLLKILSESSPKNPTISRTTENELDAIRHYLLSTGPAKRSDLEFEFNLSDKAVLRRLNMRKERGIVVQRPGHRYDLRKELRSCTR
ncbi:MAG: hypothetical protein A4E44_02186 [Methanosaeta sp. PtaB.Bin018]|nr:MAG: hypothetical protein A4E44_02186 [Methanosaeta sp. PtaB.Bin018]